MKNFLQPGETITVTAPLGGVKGGDGIVVGNLFGICAYHAAAGEPVEITVEGVFELPKASGQINEGARVWWSTTDSNVKNATGTGLFPIGCAVRAAGTNDTTVRVRLDGTATAAA